MLTNNPAMFVWFGVIICLGYYFLTLLSNSYYVEEDHLYQVGTFHLLNRAHEQSNYNGRSYSRPKLVFQSTNYYSFAIDGDIFRAITNEKELKIP